MARFVRARRQVIGLGFWSKKTRPSSFRRALRRAFAAAGRCLASRSMGRCRRERFLRQDWIDGVGSVRAYGDFNDDILLSKYLVFLLHQIAR